MTTIAEQIAAHAAARPDDPAVTCAAETLTWRELAAGAARAAAHFGAAGAREGDRIALQLPNGPAFAEAMVGAWWMGATPTPISPKLPPLERAGIIDLASPALVVAAGADDAPGHAVVTADELAAPIATAEWSPVPSPSWKAVASGGSTGRPKLIVAEQEAVVEAIAPLAALLRLPSDSTIVVPGPLSHNAPLIALAMGLMLGNHVVVMPRFDAAECLRLVEHHRARWLYQVPTMMLRIWRLPEAERSGRALSSLDVVYHMAAPCPPWLKRAWCEWLGADTICELYAGTEMQAMTTVTGSEWLAHPGTVGRVKLGEMEIRDEQGNPLPAEAVGEIWLRRGADERAPYHYVGAQPRAAAGNWESLGDMGHFDDEGYLYLADRSADMILVGGSNVYPAEVEAALDAHPAVRSSCVIGLPDDDLGNVPHAIVQLAEEVPDGELIDWVRERLAPYKVPRAVERVSAPLRDDAGKVRRSELRRERAGRFARKQGVGAPEVAR